jgi:hypothetical protein
VVLLLVERVSSLPEVALVLVVGWNPEAASGWRTENVSWKPRHVHADIPVYALRPDMFENGTVECQTDVCLCVR